MQVVVDVHACAHYMAKYVAKAEHRSRTVSDIFTSSVQSYPQDGDSRGALRRATLRAVRERDFSVQEIGYILLGLTLTNCTFSFCTLSLSLTGDRKNMRNA